MKTPSTILAPMLYLKRVGPAVEFYKKAFGATVMRQHDNSDGSVHVAEMFIGNAILRLHEEVSRDHALSPDTLGGTTVVIHLLVDDPDALIAHAVAAGALETSPMKDYEYGYRQGSIVDPFGHQWQLEKNTFNK